MEFIRPSPNGIFDTYNPHGIKLLTRLCLGLSQLNEHKFKHGCNETVNPICTCGSDIESINHSFLHCRQYCGARQNLFDIIQSIDKMLFSQNESSLTHFFTVTLNAAPVLMHSFSTQQVNSNYFQEDSMDRYLMELNFFFLSLIHFLYGFLFAFIHFVLLFLISTYIPGVCNFLHLVLLAVSFVVLNF